MNPESLGHLDLRKSQCRADVCDGFHADGYMRMRIQSSSVLCVGDYGFADNGVYPMLMQGNLAEKIKAIRLSLKLNQTEFAERLDTTQSTVARWEHGSVPTGENLERIADLAKTTIDQLLGVSELAGMANNSIPVVGFVGAGAQVFPFDDYPKGAGMDFVERPATVEGEAVAVEVRGDSLFPTAENGWRLIYAGEQTVLEDDVINRLCVVKLLDERVLVKRVMRGSQPQRYHLVSTNAPVIEDAEIMWAARVKAIIPN